MVFFFASCGASAAYLTVSEIVPMEIRAQAIALFFAIAQCFGAFAPWLYGLLTQSHRPGRATARRPAGLWSGVGGSEWYLTVPPGWRPVPAGGADNLSDRRVVLAEPPGAFRYDVRAVSEPYGAEDGELYVDVVSEHDWYRSRIRKEPVRTSPYRLDRVWVEQGEQVEAVPVDPPPPGSSSGWSPRTCRRSGRRGGPGTCPTWPGGGSWSCSRAGRSGTGAR